MKTGQHIMRALLLLSVWLGLGALAHAGTHHFYYTDPQGTVLAKADASGNIVATYDYAPYGSQALGSPTDGPGYTGHVNDSDTGLVYMQARYYDPAVGRFLSTDPVSPAVGNLSNFNRYAYANNNPVRYTDPLGRYPHAEDNPCFTVDCKREREQQQQDQQTRAYGGSVTNYGSGSSASNSGSSRNTSGSASKQSSAGSSQDSNAPSGWVNGLYYCQPNCMTPGPELDAALKSNANSFIPMFLGPPIVGATAGTYEGFLLPGAIRFGRPTLLAGCLGLGIACHGANEELQELPHQFVEQVERLEAAYEGIEAEATNRFKQVIESIHH